MTRKKVKISFITNDSARKATFKKRKKGLLKKVSELSTLCGIEACAIIYNPYETQPELWPSPDGVQNVIQQFKRMPEMEQSKKMVNQESFIRQRIAKAVEQLKKLQKVNREKEMTEVMFQCLIGKAVNEMTVPDLHDLGWLLDQRLKEVYKKMDTIKKNITMGSDNNQQLVPVPVPPEEVPPLLQLPPPPAAMTAMVPAPMQDVKPLPVDPGMDPGVHRPQWFIDWMNNEVQDQNIGFSGRDDMIMSFQDNTSTMWSSAFFP